MGFAKQREVQGHSQGFLEGSFGKSGCQGVVSSEENSGGSSVGFSEPPPSQKRGAKGEKVIFFFPGIGRNLGILGHGAVFLDFPSPGLHLSPFPPSQGCFSH